MKKSFKEFSKILTEDTKADAVAEFGEWLFGEIRKKNEPDTDSEKKLIDAILKFKDDNKLFPKNIIKKLQKIRSVYPDVLKPKDSVAYRGTRVELTDDLRKKIKKTKPVGFPNGFSYYMLDYTYKSNREITSWTNDLSGAYEFADFKRGYDPKKKQNAIPAVVRASPLDDTFFFTPEITNLLAYDILDAEDEIIRLSKKPLKGKILIDENDV